MGSCSGSDDASRRRDRYFLSREGFHFLARLNYGARGWRLFLSGRARCSRRNVEAWKETCSDKLFGGSSLNRDYQYRLENARVAHASRVLVSPSSPKRT